MNEIFDTISSELRREKLYMIYKRYGVYIVLIAVLFVLMVAGYNYYKSYMDIQNEEVSIRFRHMQADLKNLDDYASLDLLSDFAMKEKNSYGALAKFQQARRLGKLKKYEEAIIVYSHLTDDSSLPRPLRDLALLSAVSLNVGQLSAMDIESQLMSLRASDSALRYFADELVGLSYFLESHYAKAQEIYNSALSDTDIPRSVYNRLMVLEEIVHRQLIQ